MKQVSKKSSFDLIILSRQSGLSSASFNSNSNPGFTIVELLVVIVVIAILATITIVSYTSISTKATEAAAISDLSNAKNQFALYYTEHSVYPTGLDTNNCLTNATVTPNPDTNYCLKSGSGNVFALTVATGSTYTLTATKSSNTYKVTNDSSPVVVAALICPNGFIIVPGSATYGTNDFCVMKYEAKQVGSTTTPISQAAGTPWVNITQTTNIANSPNVAGCTGCHLITEAELMTIAQNVLSVTSNWSSGVVGTGYIYSGHNDNVPANALAASSDDTDGYYGTGNSSSSGADQRRTLTLTNGEVIWDMAGNVYEWTGGQTTGGQPGVAGNAYASWIQWTDVTTPGTLSPSVFPSGTGITGSSTWTSAQGIGQLLSNTAETGLRGFVRGCSWGSSSFAGVLALLLGAPSDTNTYVGFRVSR